ncbi:hypothetical protein FNV43_RR12161 [Rhamnella rubrinervis]|uniref:RNase H type-1 domain-containing protein n=1 Tax=Rhamnella rubrinervis TaxID=2594499 RepID=A0A8K0H754_9ROSA|nr:hypothetical protein FNV43_RR12161 [Rhamnella rubrinervis]
MLNEVVHTGQRKLLDFAFSLRDRLADFLGAMQKCPKALRQKGWKELWKAPSSNWLKANVDASFKDGSSAFAIVVRDEYGRVRFLASKLERVASASEAELKALVWALDLA